MASSVHDISMHSAVAVGKLGPTDASMASIAAGYCVWMRSGSNGVTG